MCVSYVYFKSEKELSYDWLVKYIRIYKWSSILGNDPNSSNIVVFSIRQSETVVNKKPCFIGKNTSHEKTPNDPLSLLDLPIKSSCFYRTLWPRHRGFKLDDREIGGGGRYPPFSLGANVLYHVYFKSEKKLNYGCMVNQNIYIGPLVFS